MPIRWTAPECLDHQKFTEKSDMWSLGILFYELWTKAELPYKGMANQKVWVNVQNGYRLPSPKGCPSSLYKIMLACWDEDSKERPTCSDIIEGFFDRRLGAAGSRVSLFGSPAPGEANRIASRNVSNITLWGPDTPPRSPRRTTSSETITRKHETIVEIPGDHLASSTHLKDTPSPALPRKATDWSLPPPTLQRTVTNRRSSRPTVPGEGVEVESEHAYEMASCPPSPPAARPPEYDAVPGFEVCEEPVEEDSAKAEAAKAEPIEKGGVATSLYLDLVKEPDETFPPHAQVESIGPSTSVMRRAANPAASPPSQQSTQERGSRNINENTQKRGSRNVYEDPAEPDQDEPEPNGYF